MTLTSLVATYRLTTPMFCAGGDQKAAAELRPASFKGILRFWYRAIALAEYGGSVDKVREAEATLFGSTDMGQARVLLSIGEITGERPLKPYSKFELGLAYLAGQGLTKYTKEAQAYLTQRPAIEPGLRFTVTCLFRPTKNALEEDEKNLKIVRRALSTVGLLGGMGSRSRRGFGSLTLEKLERKEGDTVKETWPHEDLDKQLQSLFPSKTIPSAKLEYTAFSSETQILVLPSQEKESALELLNRVGKAFVHYRSYGRNGNIAPGIKAKQWFRDDHDLMLDIAQSNGRKPQNPYAPERAAFGLPHNYYFSSLPKKQGTLEVHGAKGYDRRASPLFFHLHHPANEAPKAIVAFLPAEFLPTENLEVKQEGRTIASPKIEEPPELWQPIRDFMYELAQGHRSRLTTTFPGAKEVKQP